MRCEGENWDGQQVTQKLTPQCMSRSASRRRASNAVGRAVALDGASTMLRSAVPHDLGGRGMGMLFARMRSAVGLVRQSVERDLLVRRTDAADAALGEGSAGRVRLPARRPFLARELPAATVPMQSDASHASRTLREVVQSLQRSGAGWVTYGEARGGTAVLGVVAEDRSSA